MEYKGFEITKQYNYKVNRKQWSIYYGAGTSKTTGFWEEIKGAKLFIDWVVESNYSRNNKTMSDAYWKYEEYTSRNR